MSQVFDLCVVGSGPAGVTIAREVAASNPDLTICLLESGHAVRSALGDALRDVHSTGVHIKPASRERVLGGASSAWAGLSSPLDPIDFERRSWVPYSGWPFRLEQLAPYYRRAERDYLFPSMTEFIAARWDDIRSAGDIVPDWRELEEKLFLANDEPQRFATDFPDVFTSPRIRVVAGATANRLEGEADSGLATAVVARFADGSEVSFRARATVLACGGIENARLLLASRYMGDRGLANERDQVGRFFMNHPKAYFGTIELHRPIRELPAYFGFAYQGRRGYAGLRVPEGIQQELEILNSYVRFEPIYRWSDNPGVEAFVRLQKRLKVVMNAFLRVKRERIVAVRDYSETGDDPTPEFRSGVMRQLFAIARDLPSVARYSGARLRDRSDVPVESIRLRNFMEMAPDPENRVRLGERVDALGAFVPTVHHAPGPLDRRSMAAVHEVLREDLRAQGWGTLRSSLKEELRPWPINQDASHHIGTTRMGVDPASSVVDPKARLHGVPNVFVAGSSVFPTSGNANPTFTIVALAIRLAEHLVEFLSTEESVYLSGKLTRDA